MNNVILAKDGVQVTIATTDDTENLTKILTYITPSNSTGNRASGPKSTLIVDLQRVEKRITIRGHLVPDLTSPATFTGDTSTTAEGKKTDLKSIFVAGGTITMTYEGSTFQVNIDKLDIARSRGMEGQTLMDGEVAFDVTFTAVVGVDVFG